MPVVFAEIGSIAVQFLVEGGASAAFAEGVVAAVGTILEYAAVLELLNAAQRALSPSTKSGIGPGLFVRDENV